jgi:hypothetical protein
LIKKNSELSLKIFEPCIDSPDDYFKRCLQESPNKEYSYLDIMSSSQLCLIDANDDSFGRESVDLAALTLFDSIKFNCIPIIICDECKLPFNELIDWPLVSVRLKKSQLDKLIWVVNSFSISQLDNTLRRIEEIYNDYFSSIKVITLKTMHLLQSRIYSNDHYKSVSGLPISPVAAAMSKHFTALIVAERNLENVNVQIDFTLLKCPSLKKIIILWYGISPASQVAEQFRLKYSNKKINISIEPMRYTQKYNGIFYPYKSINTEAVLVLGEDYNFAEARLIQNAFYWWQHYQDRLILVESASPISHASLNGQLLFYHIYFSHYFYSLDAHRLLDRVSAEKEYRSFLASIYNLTKREPIVYTASTLKKQS